MDLETFRWLLTDDGQALLAAATAAEGSALQVQAALRETATAEQVTAALGQVELRAHATAKLGGDAARMYFTREGLEQATRTAVATHRAARLAVAGPSVIDLTCGIGGDLVAFARAGLTTAGIDLDPLRVEMARANLAALGLGGAVSVADATTLDVSPFGTAYADPARRSGRGRSFRPDDWTPPWTFMESLLTGRAASRWRRASRTRWCPTAWRRSGSASTARSRRPSCGRRALATVVRRATVIGRGGLATLTDEDDPGAEVGPVGAFLYEPDGAVIRAGLVTAVAAGVGGRLVDRRIAYVTSDESFRTPFARGYRVVERLPFRERYLKSALRERGIGALTIKKRGVDVSPEQLRSRLALRGDDEATLVLTRVADEGVALLVQPF